VPDLVVWENTFQSVNDALDLAAERVDCSGFIEDTRSRQEAALIQSYRAICRLSFVVYGVRYAQAFSLQDATEEDRALFPSNFLSALRMAQVVHANILLGGGSDNIASYAAIRRQAGILEERIGDTNIKYAPNAQSNSVVPLAALAELAGFVYASTRIARA
jgi:hypothetical protein